MDSVKYKRILLKISGEALAGNNRNGFDIKSVENVVKQIVEINKLGVQVGVVVGGGNFWRGRQGTEMERTTADYMGMLATVINALALGDAIKQKGVDAKVLTALSIDKIGETYSFTKANEYLNDGKVVIFGCGTGCPYFSTDTGASLKAVEIQADVLLLAKNIDGIYDSDPKTNPNAKRYEELSYLDFIKNDLKAMDMAAVTMCMENKLKVFAFGLKEENSIVDACKGTANGTWIK